MTPSPDSPTPPAKVPQPKSSAAAAPPATPEASAAEFFIVGIGASAGGLEAISEVLKRLPRQASLVVAIVQHLDPHHASMLVELLNRVSTLPVQWATHGLKVQ